MTLADTNILLRAIQRDNPSLRAAARTAVKTLLRRGDPVCVTPQNLIEFWNVSTRPLEVNGLGLNLQEADRAILRCESFFTVLPETPAIYPEWRRLVRTFGVSGLKVHDARLVASMNVHGVKCVLTFDVEDFKRYTGITVLHPAEVGP